MVRNKDIYGEHNVTLHWYALHTKHRHEKLVDARLKVKKIDSYLPLNTVYRRWSDRYKKVEEQLFKLFCLANCSFNAPYSHN